MTEQFKIASQFEGKGDEFELGAALDTIALHWKLVSFVFLTCLVIGAGYAFFAPAVYQSDALIQVEERKGTTLPGLQQLASVLDVDQSPTLGEIEIIKSRDVFGVALNALHLEIESYPNNRVPYFAGAFERRVGGVGVEASPPRFGFDSLAWGGEELVLDELTVPRTFYDRKFKIIIKASDQWTLLSPDGVAVVSGKVGDLTQFSIDGLPGTIRIHKLTARAGESFSLIRHSDNEAFSIAQRRVRVSEAVRQSSIIKVTGEASDPHAAASLVNEIAKAYLAQNVSRRSEEAEKSLLFLNGQLPQLKANVENAEKAFNEYRLQKQSVNLDKESESLLNRSVDLEKQRVEMELRRQDLIQRFQSSNPDVVTLDNQLGAVHQEEGRLTEDIKRLPETEQELLRLDRDVKVNTDLYISLLNNAQQLQIAKAGTVGNVRIIDFPVPDDRPIRPMRALIVAVAFTIGAILAIASAFVARGLNPTLTNSDEIERITGLSTYANVPNSEAQRSISARRTRKANENNLLEVVSPTDFAVEALRSMRMGLQFAIGSSRNRVVCITGPLPSLGKTFVATNLAAVLASAGERVLLIDGDLRRPTVHEYFGHRRSPGLSEILADTCELAAAIRSNVLPNLDMLCAGISPPNPSELLLRPKFQELLEEASKHYKYVVIDTAPLLPVGDTLAIAKLASAVFMVLRAGDSTMESFADALRRLETTGIKPTGLIFNGIKLSRLGYGSKYQYGYTAQ